MKHKIINLLDTLTDEYVPNKLEAVMKATEEIPQSPHALEKRAEKQAHIVWRKVLVPVACCCLIALMGIGVWRSGMLPAPPVTLDNNSAISSDHGGIPGNVILPSDPDVPEPVISDVDEPYCTDPIQPPDAQNIIINWDNVVVNESAGTLDAAPLYRDPGRYVEETWGEKEIVAYYGWNLMPGYIPEGLSAGSLYVAIGIWRERATGEIVEDQAGRGFWSDGSLKSDDDIVIPARITVIASKLGIRHCVLLPVDESETTDFGGVPVTLSHCSLPYGPFDPTQKAPNGGNMPAGYYDIYVASFTLDGVEYEIKAQRLELEELIKIVASVINVPSGENFTVG